MKKLVLILMTVLLMTSVVTVGSSCGKIEEEKLLEELTEESAPAPPPAPAPAPAVQSKIAFVSYRDGNSEIYIIDADGSNQTRLTSYNDKHIGIQELSRSSDGKKIAFILYNDLKRTLDLYVMNSDGTNQRQLTKGLKYVGHPGWSPDGKKIAFDSSHEGYRGIYVMDIDGSNLRRIIKDGECPAWSPDGKKIAFLTVRDRISTTRHGIQIALRQIYAMNADGSNITRLTNTPDGDNLWPAWSPDGTRIAFVCDRDGKRAVYVMNADGSNETRLTNSLADDEYPTWSPDGTRIAFTSRRDGNGEIYVMNADGSNVVRLTNNPDVFHGGLFPAWSP